MADTKRYYYLKLKDDFFESDEMIVLESMPDGYLYSNILLKLYLRSLKNEGRLMFNNRIPFNSTMLAQVTRHSVGVIEKAMRVLQELGLVEVLDNGAIYMADIQNFIGRSSTEADRKRAYRARIEAEKKNKKLPVGQVSGQMSGQTGDKSPPEIEIELEKELEIEIDQPPAPHEKIKTLYNDLCPSLPQVRAVSERRKKHLRARWKQFDCDLATFKKVFKKVEASDFCRGENDRGWKADFDWLIRNDENMLKVLEGKYDNRSDDGEGDRQRPWEGWEDDPFYADFAAGNGDAEGGATSGRVN